MTEVDFRTGELDDEYHADEWHIGSTSLRLFGENPAKYHAQAKHGLRLFNQDSEALLLGKLVHCMVLEPDTLHDRYAEGPNTKRGSAKWVAAEAKASADGQALVRSKVWGHAVDMAAAFHASEAGEYLARMEDGIAEASIRWVDEASGVRCKCRPDYIGHIDGQLTCIDLKTSADSFNFNKFGYHVQQAFYEMGLAAWNGEPVHFVFAVIDKRAPYLCSRHVMPDQAVMAAEYAIGQWLEEYAKYDRGELPWPDITKGVQTVSVPDWEINKLVGEV